MKALRRACRDGEIGSLGSTCFVLSAPGYDPASSKRMDYFQCIKDNLGGTYRTVSFHIESILNKLEVQTRPQAITWINQNMSDNL